MSGGFGTRGLEEEPLTVRIPVAAQLTGLGKTRIYELIESGDLKSIKLGRARLILFCSLKQLVGA